MAIFNRKKKQTRSAEIISGEAFSEILKGGYTPLAQNPEVLTACRTVADIISSMTLYLMSNTDKGDKRIVNELSRKLDIYPNSYMTRKTFIDFIVMNMLLYGKGNAFVIPHTEGGILAEFEPVSFDRVSFLPERDKVMIDGKPVSTSDILHFVYNPDKNYPWRGAGITTALRDVADNLTQAAATTKGFMQSKWKPSIIIKVDGLTEEFSSKSGRKKLLESFIETDEAGEPWMIPAEQFSVEQVRPLSLADLAISDTVTLDKKTVAAIVGVPSFVLGVGNYNAAEWDGFISNKIRPIVREIEQELTRKLLISPKWYWRFNIQSLYSYDIKNTADVYSNLFVRGIVTGNEVRDKLSMEPLEGLDNLTILENYIPLEKIGDQLKLKQGEE